MKRLILLPIVLGLLFGMILSGCNGTSSNNLITDNAAHAVTRESFVGFWIPANATPLYWSFTTEKGGSGSGNVDQGISINEDGTFSVALLEKSGLISQVGVNGTWTIASNQITFNTDHVSVYPAPPKIVKATSATPWIATLNNDNHLYFSFPKKDTLANGQTAPVNNAPPIEMVKKPK